MVNKIKKINSIPFDFALERLQRLSPTIKPMFGCHAVYIGNKIVLILRNKATDPYDNGVWLATTKEHHVSLKINFPIMRSIQLLGKGISSWQNIPMEADQFEEAVMTVCDMILKNDTRIGKIPAQKKSAKKR